LLAGKWHAVLVPPQASRVLETQLRKLAHGARGFEFALGSGDSKSGCPQGPKVSKKGREAAAAIGRPQGPPGPCHFNKEQTPLGDLCDPNPRFHGGCFGV